MQHVYQLGMGFIVSAALGTATRLDIPDHLAHGPRTTSDLARAASAHEDALYRLLRALSTVGVFHEPAPRTFALTPVGELLRSGAPGGARDMILWMCDAFHYRGYAEMLSAVQTGQTVGEKVVGMPVFEFGALFERAGFALTRIVPTQSPLSMIEARPR